MQFHISKGGKYKYKFVTEYSDATLINCVHNLNKGYVHKKKKKKERKREKYWIKILNTKKTAKCYCNR